MKIRLPGEPTADATLLLEPGHWINDINGTPSFSPEADYNNKAVNAFRVTGYIPTDKKLVFAGIISKPVIGQGVNLVAATVPRRVVILVDISDSTVRETHIVKNTADQIATPEQGHGSYYGMLPTGSSMDTLTGQAGVYNNGISFTPYDAQPNSQTLVLQNPNLIQRPLFPPEIVTINPDIRHFWSDYRLISGFTDPEYSSVCSSPFVTKVYPPTSTYLSDTCAFAPPEFPNSANKYNVALSWKGSIPLSYYVDSYPATNVGPEGYGGPQPLSSIFRSIHRLVGIFENRAIGGDRIGIIFYDSRFMWSRIVRPTNDWTLLNYVTDFNDKSPNGPWEFMMRLGFFPGAVTQSALVAGTDIVSLPFTNSLEALQVAKQLLISNQMEMVTADSLVMIGDGLANCYKSTYPTGNTLCSNSYTAHLNALNQMKSFALSDLIPRGVPVNVVLVGKSVAPHTLQLEDPNNSGKCLTDTYARVAGKPFVRGLNANLRQAAFNAMTPTNPYYQVNADMYEIAATTGGLWAPIRRQPIGAEVEPACNTSDTLTAPRLEFDPQGRTTEQQIDSYMTDMMRDNPYIIVDIKTP